MPAHPHYRIVATSQFVRIEHFDEIRLSLPRRHFASMLHRQWANILDPVAADAFCYGALAMFAEMTAPNGAAAASMLRDGGST